MTLDRILFALMVLAFAFGFAACAALTFRRYSLADALLAVAFGSAGSMVPVSVASAYALL
jgi:hypothetical protein